MVDSNKQFDTIEVADIELSKAHDSEAHDNETQVRQTRDEVKTRKSKSLSIYLIAILSLLALSLAFILLQNHRRANDLIALQDTSAPDSAAQTSSSVDVSDGPYKQEQTAAQRRAAQNILASLLEKQHLLENRQVALWADTDYEVALNNAEQGDLLYQRRQFEEAQKFYSNSLALLSDIEARITPLIASSMAVGLSAIEAGEIKKARDAFDLLFAIEPGNEAANSARQRLEQLPHVLELLSTANANFATGEFQAALDAFQSALKLDPQYQAAIAGSDNAKIKIKENKFQTALNQGYNFLQQSNYSSATKAFGRALAIDPGSSVAADAQLQAQTELNETQVNHLLAAAGDHELQERWQQALEAYEQSLDIDSSVIAATVGKIRSQTRANLDTNLSAMIAAPLRLSTPGVHRQARQLLADAKQINSGGQQLEKQIKTLGELLLFADTPLPITLISDNNTAVTLLRVDKLGLFSEKTISLKPGKYTAEGVRRGYRDVRVNFIVDGNNTGAPIRIVCKEAI